MKLVAESFPWSSDSRFLYTLDNHNSAVGMRELALNAGASAVAVDFVPGISEGKEGHRALHSLHPYHKILLTASIST